MKRFAAMMILICMLLSGCMSIFDGSYISTRPHEVQSAGSGQILSASDPEGLMRALARMVENGEVSGVINVNRYDSQKVESDIREAVRRTMVENPVAAYAVENIDCQLGTSGGQNAVAVKISYIHDRTEIKKIRRVQDLESARAVITAALDQCATGVVVYLQDYTEADFAQLVEDYADNSPRTVMETPRVSVNIYPKEGTSRVVELKFVYQNSRDALRSMQSQVGTLFDAAVSLVSVTEDTREKYSQMYSVLMERFEEFQIGTSITPAYSLLVHGVGDARSFALIYAAMCRQAGLECRTITGTRYGQPWYWNQIGIDGVYYHVDLLRCLESEGFEAMTDSQITADYIWDYSAFPQNDQ